MVWGLQNAAEQVGGH